MWKFIKKIFSLIPEDEIKTKSFIDQLCGAINRAEKTRKLILHSDLPEKDRLQIADEILYLVDDLRELQTIRLMEIETLCQLNIRPPFGLF